LSAISIVVIIIILSSQIETDISAIRYENVILDSDIVEFANVSLEKHINESGFVDKVTVKWLFHNIDDRTINATIVAEFYDKNDALLYTAHKQLLLLPPDYTEKLLLPANMISYNGENASKVEYVIISTIEF